MWMALSTIDTIDNIYPYFMALPHILKIDLVFPYIDYTLYTSVQQDKAMVVTQFNSFLIRNKVISHRVDTQTHQRFDSTFALYVLYVYCCM